MSAEGWVSLLTGGVGAVTVLATWLMCLLTGKLHTDDEFGREVARRELAEKRAETLERALGESRQALAEASGRADAAVRASELIADALADAKSRERLPKGTSGRRQIGH